MGTRIQPRAGVRPKTRRSESCAAMCKVFVGLRSGAARRVDQIPESEDVHLWSHYRNSFGLALSDVFGTI